MKITGDPEIPIIRATTQLEIYSMSPILTQ